MEILIENQQDRRSIASKALKKKAAVILSALDCPEGELSLLLVDDAQMAVLNRQYRGRSGTTNVLAFSMQEGAFPDVMPDLLGDVVISVETCEREALAAGVSFERRFDELLVHGVLHLFGYDHEISAEEEHRMKARSDRLLQRLEEAGEA